MYPNAAFIHVERRGLDREILAAENIPGTCFLQIPAAHLSDCHAFAGFANFIGRVFAHDDCRKLHHGQVACLFDRQRAEAAEIQAALDPFARSSFSKTECRLALRCGIDGMALTGDSPLHGLHRHPRVRHRQHAPDREHHPHDKSPTPGSIVARVARGG